MKTRSSMASMVFLCTTALTGAALVGGSLEGCRSDSGSGNGGSTTATTTHTSTGAGGGDGGAVQIVTIQQIVDPTAVGHVGAKTPVKLVGVVAMSIKFLVSKSSSGSCLWGVFVSAPGLTTTAANTGMLALSYGTSATALDGGKAYCPTIQAGQPAGDAFPDDIAPGDVLDITGETDSYIPSTCSAADAGVGSSNVQGIQLSKVTLVDRTGTAAVPAPYVLSASDLTSLAAGSDMTWLDKWGNVRVQADDVTVEPQGGVLTDAYGHMLLQAGTNGIQVGDKLYYVGYVKATDACYSGPIYTMPLPFTLTSVTGFVYLDYCNWGLVPGDKCNDLVPPSIDCANAVTASDGGGATDSGADNEGGTDPDAGTGDGGGPAPSVVCSHLPKG